MIRVLISAIFGIAAFGLLSIRTPAHPAWGIAVDRQGQVYFSDLKTVWKIDGQGRLTVFRARIGDTHTHDLNVDEDGNVYGADNSYDPATKRFLSGVWKITAAGEFSYILPLTEDPPAGTSIWKDRDGNMYHVANHPGRELLVLKRIPSGNVTVLVGNRNTARSYRQGVPYSIGGMAFDPDGALYFTHGANVSKVSMNGVLTALARDVKLENGSGNLAGGTRLFGIAVDTQANAFVADYGNRRILKISRDGQMSTVIRAEQSWIPTGVAESGRALYILEASHTPAQTPIGARVRKLSRDGTVITLATVGENTASSEGPIAGETSGGENPEIIGAPEHSMQYALFAAGASIFVLTIIGWRIGRRM